MPVAKHGNRGVTSRSGSADVLAGLGVNIEATVPQVERCLNELGICFCFAPLMHPAMRHVSAVRKQLGIRTIFNLLGPLANPAGAQYQLLGVGRAETRPLIASALALLGSERSYVVCGEDGLGEVTLSGKTLGTEVTRAGERDFSWVPEDFGIPRCPLGTIEIATPADSVAMVQGVLAGEYGPARDIVVLNAAAGLLVVGYSDNPRDAAGLAAESIDSGAAANLLQRLVRLSHEPVS
jgi:anthranilate phosphoribosyltransferase